MYIKTFFILNINLKSTGHNLNCFWLLQPHCCWSVLCVDIPVGVSQAGSFKKTLSHCIDISHKNTQAKIRKFLFAYNYANARLDATSWNRSQEKIISFNNIKIAISAVKNQLIQGNMYEIALWSKWSGHSSNSFHMGNASKNSYVYFVYMCVYNMYIHMQIIDVFLTKHS